MLWLVWGSICVAITVLSAILVLAYPDPARWALPLAIGLSALYLIILSGSMAWYEWTLHVTYFGTAGTGESFRHASGLLGPSPEVWIGPHMAGVYDPLPNQSTVDGWLCAYGALFLASLIGKATWRIIERLLYRIPIIKAVYPNVKQVTDFLLTERTLQFSGVVAVQYPRKGLWSLGLVTGPPMRSLQQAAGEELMTVFIPSSPTPVTGYVITVARSDVIELGLTMDEAMRYSISAGVIKPERETLDQAAGSLPAKE